MIAEQYFLFSGRQINSNQSQTLYSLWYILITNPFIGPIKVARHDLGPACPLTGKYPPGKPPEPFEIFT
jgi:hypothetical protein